MKKLKANGLVHLTVCPAASLWGTPSGDHDVRRTKPTLHVSSRAMNIPDSHPLPANEIRRLKLSMYLVLCLIAPIFIGVMLLGDTAHNHVPTWYAAFAAPLSLVIIIFALKRVWTVLPPEERRLGKLGPYVNNSFLSNML